MASARTGYASGNSDKGEALKSTAAQRTQDIKINSTKTDMPRPIDEGKARDYNVHAADSFAYSVDKSMKAIDNIILEDFHMPQLCPWHTQQVMCTNKHGAGMDPMERYMAEAETEQSAVYRGIREGTLSITKACTCAELLSAAKSSKSKVSSVGHC